MVNSIYENFEDLNALEIDGKDFQITTKYRKSGIVVIAPHGGRIEPGTSEIAKYIADEIFAFYLFEGMKPADNKRLHIKSTKFDEPECVKLLGQFMTAVTIHGFRSKDDSVLIGGLHEELKGRLIDTLRKAGFNAKEDNTNHPGKNKNNICNRALAGMGVQIEISRGLRKRFFNDLKKIDTGCNIEIFNSFISSIQKVLKSIR